MRNFNIQKLKGVACRKAPPVSPSPRDVGFICETYRGLTACSYTAKTFNRERNAEY